MTEWQWLINGGIAAALLVIIVKWLGRTGDKLIDRTFPIIERYVSNTERLHEKLDGRIGEQQVLCERHAEAMGSIAQLLDRHDKIANHRTEVVDELLRVHNDPSVPHSTAEAIRRIEQLHDAAISTCAFGREVGKLASPEMAAAVCRHCDAIETILKHGV